MIYVKDQGVWKEVGGGGTPEASRYTRIISGSGTLIPPPGAKFMRVAAIGGGAGGGAYRSDTGTGRRAVAGGGGGCAATRLIPAVPFEYTIGAGGAGRSSTAPPVVRGENGGDTIASIPGYGTLIGGGGIAETPNSSDNTTVGGRGVGSGGDYNFNGGGTIRVAGLTTSNIYSEGGGGAGPSGNGGNGGRTNGANSQPGQLSSNGWGCGGGSGGNQLGSTLTPTGAGAGADSYSGSVVLLTDGVIFGRPNGEMGGGGMAGYSSSTIRVYDGGTGGLVVEWFFG